MKTKMERIKIPVDTIRRRKIEERIFLLPSRKKKWWLLPSIFVFTFFLFCFFFFSKEIDLFRIYRGLNGKYLILFQNNNELRASGGFIGSYALVDFEKGRIKDYYFEANPYKRDNAFLKENCLSSPFFFKEVWPDHCLKLTDSNNDLDFRKAAETVAWFLKKEGGDEVKGVIALDTTFSTELLKIIGPISMPKYKTVLDAQNFVPVVQYKVEKEYFQNPENIKINEPKTILKEMMPKVLSKMKNVRFWPKILKLTRESLASKHLLFYFRDSKLEKIALENNWAGAVKNFQGDYLFISESNIGGGKTSQRVKQEIKLEVSHLHKLTIKRTYPKVGDWLDALNQNFMRISVPQESKLVSAFLNNQDIKNEVKIKEETKKTSFGLWINTAPSESQTLVLTYQTPKINKENYSLLIQKQPGASASRLEVKLNNQILLSGLLDKDKEIRKPILHKLPRFLEHIFAK